MKSDQDRLRWAVAVAGDRVDDDAFRRGLASFLDGPGSDIQVVPDDDPATLSEIELQRLRSTVEDVIDLTMEGSEGGFIPRASVERQILLAPQRRKGSPTKRLLIITGPLRDVVIEVLYQLLLRSPIERIRRCPGCGQKFYRSGRQTHCTTECYDRAYWARLDSTTVERYRAKQYDAYGWTRGARGASLPRIATKSRTGGKRRAQRKHAGAKKPAK